MELQQCWPADNGHRLGTYHLDYTESLPNVVIRGCGDRLGGGRNEVIVQHRSKYNWTHKILPNAHISKGPFVQYVQIVGTRGKHSSQSIISSNTKTILLHDLETLQRKQKIESNGISHTCLHDKDITIQSDTKTNNTIKLINNSTLEITDEFSTKNEILSLTSIKSQEFQFIGGGTKGNLNYFDIRNTAEPFFTYKNEMDINYCTLSTNSSKLFAIGNYKDESFGGSLQSFNLEDKKVNFDIQGYKLTDGTLDCDEKKVCFVNLYRNICIWDVNGFPLHVSDYDGFMSWRSSLKLSESGSTLIVGGTAGSCLVQANIHFYCFEGDLAENPMQKKSNKCKIM